MPTLNKNIAASADDGHWSSGGSFAAASGEMYAGNISASFNTWLRFTNITIPQGATINSATLTVEARASVSAATCNWLIDANDVDSATAPTDATDAANKARTTAQVTYNSVPAFTAGNSYNMPDIASVIQEVVDRAGWSSGNALMIFIRNNASSSFAYRENKQYDEDTTATALAIDYTEAASGNRRRRAIICGAAA